MFDNLKTKFMMKHFLEGSMSRLSEQEKHEILSGMVKHALMYPKGHEFRHFLTQEISKQNVPYKYELLKELDK